MIKFIQKIRWAAIMLVALFASQTASAQSTAVCQNFTTQLSPNGYAVVYPQDIDGGSIGGVLIMNNGSLDSAIYFTCADLTFDPNGMAVVQTALVALDANGQATGTCLANVYVFDTLGMCNGSNPSYSPADTALIYASDCNTCDGQASVVLIDASTGLPATNTGPYYFSWSDGLNVSAGNLAASYRNDLCPNQTYSIAIIDGLQNTYTYTLYMGCNGGGTGAANAVCAGPLTLDLAPNGYAVVTTQMIDGGSTGGTPYIIGSNTAGGWNSAYTYTCSDLGTQTITLAVLDSLSSTASTCTTTVTIIDTTNICGGQGGSGYVIDSFMVDASDCNTCDGQYAFGFLMNANGMYVNVTNIVWQDGVVGGNRYDLCPNTPYTFTAYDANQNAYTHTVYVGCNNPAAGNCIDPTRIDTNAVCPAIYAPVCGCNGVTYSNDCEAYYMNGVTSWTAGPCSNGSNITTTVVTTGTGCDTVCTGSAVVTASISGALGNFFYNWSNGAIGAVQQGLCAGVYTVVITETNTNSTTTLSVVIGTAQGCVWPGDTDDNTSVNNWDILPIGLAYGESGAARLAQDNNWEAHSATDWNTVTPLPNMPNYKHIDSNGDGLVDLMDTQALFLNYGNSYFRSPSTLVGTIPLSLGSITTQEGVRIGLPINFGTAAMIAQDVYGLAFTVHYDPTMVIAGSVDVDFTNSWLGADLLTVVKDFPALGLVEIGIVRKDRQNITNFGSIGTLNLTISDDILRSPASKTMNMEVTTVLVVDNGNRRQGADTQTGVVTIELNTAIDQISDDYKVNVFPNPSNTVVNIQTTNTWIEDLQLMTITGQLVAQQLNVAAPTAILPVSELPAGVYLLSIKTEKGISHERINIAH